MAINGLVKRLQNIMRSDAGVNGDAQRIEQMVWAIFLKVYDSIEENWIYEAEDRDEQYISIIPEELRWHNWAHAKDEEGKDKNNTLTGEELLDFVDNRLFPVLRGKDVKYKELVETEELDEKGIKKRVLIDREIKGIKVTHETPRGKAIVQDVFMEANQYMKNGVLLRQLINEIDEIDLLDNEQIHAFGDIYESILKDLQGAGHAGEFYTPRALTDFIIQVLNPCIGEKVGDFAMGTGGFLVSALRYLQKQMGDNAENVAEVQNALIGQEWKPFPYLLAATNLMLHGVENPEIYHMDSLGRPMSEYERRGKVKVIAMNPPYGGSTEASTKMNFKTEFRSSETADLFMVLIMQRLDLNGRAGVIVPDGFLFGTDGAKLAIKEKLLRSFNLHTIIRLPSSIFSPYTSIATNIIFFNNETAEGAAEGFKTNRTWFYRMDMPEGYIHFSKTRPMTLAHCEPIIEWWDNRREMKEGEDIKSVSFSAQELLDLSCNFDQCKFLQESEEVLSPVELLRDYQQRRNALDIEIDNALQDIQQMLGIKL